MEVGDTEVGELGDTHFSNAGSHTRDCIRDTGVPIPS
jgi:hypothetical protein